jgi:hypothetical protein
MLASFVTAVMMMTPPYTAKRATKIFVLSADMTATATAAAFTA